MLAWRTKISQHDSNEIASGKPGAVQSHKMRTTGKVIGIELTEKCNFSCVHCYLERKIRPKLSMAALLQLANSADIYGFHTVYITGGEPTINPLFIETYNLFRGRGYITHVFSNGSYLTEEILGAFNALNPHRVEISLYGMSEETYEAVVGSRSLSTVLANIQRLKDAGIEIFLKYNILSINKKDLRAFLDYCAQNNFSYALNAQIIPMNNGDLTPIQYRLPAKEIAEIGKEFGVKFDPSGDGYDRCDVGESIFIDSQGRIRGCPVLFTDVDKSLFSNEHVDFDEIERLFVSLRAQKKGKYCPAWTASEGSGAVAAFLEDLKFYAQRNS